MATKRKSFFSGASRFEVILTFVGLFVIFAFASTITLSLVITEPTPMQAKVCDTLLEIGKSGFVCFLTLIGAKVADINQTIN